MADVRLIDANALLKEIEDWHDSLGGTMNPADWGVQNVLQSVMDSIIEAEDIDAVSVVRCRNCRLWRRTEKHYGKCPFLIGEHQYHSEDGFCNLGENMDGGAEL